MFFLCKGTANREGNFHDKARLLTEHALRAADTARKSAFYSLGISGNFIWSIAWPNFFFLCFFGRNGRRWWQQPKQASSRGSDQRSHHVKNSPVMKSLLDVTEG